MPRIALIVLTATLLGCGRHELTPLAAAARRGDVNAIRALLSAGADPNAPSGVNGWTPLMHAIHKNKYVTATALVDGGADVNAACCGTTALIMAAGYGQEAMVRGLLERGADPRRQPYGVTALDAAITGVADIDDFTLGKCMNGAVKALLDVAPDLVSKPKAVTHVVRFVKSCPDVEALMQRARQAK